MRVIPAALSPWRRSIRARIVIACTLLFLVLGALLIGAVYTQVGRVLVVPSGPQGEHIEPGGNSQVNVATDASKRTDFLIFTLASMGLPGTSGFVGEFLVIVGSLQVNFWLALLGATGMILGAAYMLYLYRRIIFGRLTKEDLRSILDLSPREIAVFVPLILLTLWMGIYPSSFTGFWDASVASMESPYLFRTR